MLAAAVTVAGPALWVLCTIMPWLCQESSELARAARLGDDCTWPYGDPALPPSPQPLHHRRSPGFSPAARRCQSPSQSPPRPEVLPATLQSPHPQLTGEPCDEMSKPLVPLLRQTKDGVNGCRLAPAPRSSLPTPMPTPRLSPLVQGNGATLTGASDGGVKGSDVKTYGSSGQEEPEGKVRRERNIISSSECPVVERPTTREGVAAAEQPSGDNGRSKCTIFQGEAEATKTHIYHDDVVARTAVAEDGGSGAAAFSVAFGTKDYNARRKQRAARGYATLRQLGRELCKTDTL